MTTDIALAINRPQRSLSLAPALYYLEHFAGDQLQGFGLLGT